MKFGLLRWLVPAESPASLRLGVVWYRPLDEGHNADGKHIAYLRPGHRSAARLRRLDPDLYQCLAGIVTSGCRSTAALADAGVLTAGTCFFGDPLDFTGLPPGPAGRTGRQARRRTWLEQALAATAACQLIFADPDNGIRPAGHPRTARRRSNTPISTSLLPSPSAASPSSSTTMPIAARPSTSRHAPGWPTSPAVCPYSRSLPCVPRAAPVGSSSSALPQLLISAT